MKEPVTAYDDPVRAQTRAQIVSLVKAAVRNRPINGKCGPELQKLVATHLGKNGLAADTEDTREFLSSAMPVWRSKENCLVEPTRGRRRIDIVVYSDYKPIGLVEIESDLDDLKAAGVSKRRGHYDVFSISRSGSESYYNSYKSLERMAAAAFYRATPEDGPAQLEKICSDEPEIHNPTGLAIILVVGRCRTQDSEILKPRLNSLAAELVCVSAKCARP